MIERGSWERNNGGVGPREDLPPPTPGVVVERLRTEATTWINAVHLQAGRIDRRHAKLNLEPAEGEALEIDLHFFLVSLTRLRRCVRRVAERVPVLGPQIAVSVAQFDSAVPALSKLRNVSEHIDEYNLDVGRDRVVSRRDVQVWYLDRDEDGGPVWGWLGERLDIRLAERASTTLYRSFVSECETWATTHHR